jgi:hypothetical protein
VSTIDAFRRAGISVVLAPGDAGYADAVAGFDLGVEAAPSVVVDAQTATDVASAVSVAAEQGTQLTALGSGHGRLGPLTAGAAISLRKLDTVEVDASARTVRIGAGCTWAPVVAAAAVHGLAAPCGSAPSVGVVGYLLGGGIGPLARSFGYSTDHVRSFEVVTPADGPITVSRDAHPDLFWAMRGGKVGFGVVTAVTVELLPYAEITGGGVYFGADAAADVVAAYADWAAGLPESTTTSIALLRLPDSPVLPPALSGRHVAHVRFATLDAFDAAQAQLVPLRGAATPLLDTVGVLPYAQVGSIHADPTAPMPVANGTASLTTFDHATVDAVLASGGLDVDLPLSAVEIRTLGGATLRESDPDAVGGRPTQHLLNVYAAPVPSLPDEVRLAAVRSVLAATAAHHLPNPLVNFVGRANAPRAFETSWRDDQKTRLDDVRHAHDPASIFVT